MVDCIYNAIRATFIMVCLVGMIALIMLAAAGDGLDGKQRRPESLSQFTATPTQPLGPEAEQISGSSFIYPAAQDGISSRPK